MTVYHVTKSPQTLSLESLTQIPSGGLCVSKISFSLSDKISSNFACFSLSLNSLFLFIPAIMFYKWGPPALWTHASVLFSYTPTPIFQFIYYWHLPQLTITPGTPTARWPAARERRRLGNRRWGWTTTPSYGATSTTRWGRGPILQQHTNKMQ